jgi:hypothetical protein
MSTHHRKAVCVFEIDTIDFMLGRRKVSWTPSGSPRVAGSLDLGVEPANHEPALTSADDIEDLIT